MAGSPGTQVISHVHRCMYASACKIHRHVHVDVEDAVCENAGRSMDDVFEHGCRLVCEIACT